MQDINSVQDMLAWKSGIIKHDSVEQSNIKKIGSLGWKDKDIDTLYSFLLTYKLGLEIIDKKKFDELAKEYKKEKELERLNRMSPQFIDFCSKAEAYNELNNNEHMKEFVNLYFTIGNVIPIWPGGNEARGKKGIYDIPEIFFNMYPEWTNELVRQNEESIYLESVINNNLFFISKEKNDGITIKGYKDLFKSIQELKKVMIKNNEIYFDYLCHRNNVIKERNLQLEKFLEKKEEGNNKE